MDPFDFIAFLISTYSRIRDQVNLVTKLQVCFAQSVARRGNTVGAVELDAEVGHAGVGLGDIVADVAQFKLTAPLPGLLADFLQDIKSRAVYESDVLQVKDQLRIRLLYQLFQLAAYQL